MAEEKPQDAPKPRGRSQQKQDDEEQGMAPAPEPPKPEDLVVDLADRATVVGPANMANPDVDKPDDAFDLARAEALAEAEERKEPDETPAEGKPVEFFQVASNNGAVVIRFDGDGVLLDAQQALALQRDLQSALANVTY